MITFHAAHLFPQLQHSLDSSLQARERDLGVSWSFHLVPPLLLKVNDIEFEKKESISFKSACAGRWRILNWRRKNNKSCKSECAVRWRIWNWRRKDCIYFKLACAVRWRNYWSGEEGIAYLLSQHVLPGEEYWIEERIAHVLAFKSTCATVSAEGY